MARFVVEDAIVASKARVALVGGSVVVAGTQAIVVALETAAAMNVAHALSTACGGFN